MVFELPKLPYDMDALKPHVSKETLEYHHGKHHKAYVDKLNTLVIGTEFTGMTLEEVIKKSSGAIFNNAAQIWNHTFYWHSMRPNGGGEPKGPLLQAIEKKFGSFDAFKEKFTQTGLNQFGSGWAWLYKLPNGEVDIYSTSNAATPLTEADKKALLTCDVWEHAYYIDTRNDRAKYINNFWNLVNWEFAENNFKD